MQGPGVQIMNTDPFGKGQHWILVSTLHCDDGVIDIYDSAQGSYLRSSVVECLAKYIPTKTGDSLTFRFILCDKQKNGNDCGMYAICNMVSLLHNQDPCSLVYPAERLRRHLRLCMENRSFTVFPYCDIGCKPGSRVTAIHTENLFCTCKMPEDDSLYFECTKCRKWYHPQCQGLGFMTQEEINAKKTLKCIKCQGSKK